MKENNFKKKWVVVAYKEGEKSTEQIAQNFDITRATLYRWLGEAGVAPTRRTTKHINAELERVMKHRGVCEATAQKYIKAQKEMEDVGCIDLKRLGDVGISKARIRSAIEFLDVHGVPYDLEHMVLGKRAFTVEQIIDLILEPVEFLSKL
jgi:transposase-like protein